MNKFNILMKQYSAEAMAKTGETGVTDILLGNKENLEGTGYTGTISVLK